MSVTRTLEQILKNNFDGDKFDRVDTIVRYLAIEQYFGKNDYGFDMYIKMQMNRCRLNKVSAVRRLHKFKQLIESIKNNGFNSKIPITVTKNGILIDGSHRFACSLYFSINPTYVKIINNDRKTRSKYSLNWFSDKFTEKEIKIIKAKTTEILLKYLDN